MELWIENKIGYLDGYSIIEQPNTVKIEVSEEPLDFTNWRYDGSQLLYDPSHAPQPDPAPPSDLDLLKQQNEALRQRLDMSDDALLELADKILSTTKALKGGK